MLVVPSPKFQAHVVTDPVVVLVNATLNGATPVAGLALKPTTGAGALTLIALAAVLLAVPPAPVAVEDNCIAARRAVDVRGALHVAGGAVAEVPGPHGDRSGGRVGERNAQRCDAGGRHLR